MPRRTQKQSAEEIRGLLEKGKTHAWIMANRKDLANGWNEVAKEQGGKTTTAKAATASRQPRGGGAFEPHRTITSDMP